MAVSKLTILAIALMIFVLFSDDAAASLAVGRHMRPGRSLAVGRTFRPGRSLASGRPFFRPGKRAPEIEEMYMSDYDRKRSEMGTICRAEIIDDYTNELVEVVKRMVDFERSCDFEEETPNKNLTTAA